MCSEFLPVSKADLVQRGIKQLDFVMVTGDAYVDHPSFGAAIIARVLENRGFLVGIIAQPDWKDKDSFKILGKPRLAFLVTSGNMDSMVSNYTAARKKRKNDIYSPGQSAGKRPDRAVTVYCNRIRDAYGDVPVVIGGIEASLRRMAHYDYWEDRVKRSVLLDSRADLLVYGMGEKQILEIADSLDSGIDIRHMTYVPGTVYKAVGLDNIGKHIKLYSFDEVSEDKEKYALSFMKQYENGSPMNSEILVEQYDDKTYIIQNPPDMPMDRLDLDDVYGLPYTRRYHTVYESAGGIKALEEVENSITSSRGCFGGCSYCALTFHQGRMVSSRSHDSIISEAQKIIGAPGFKGFIHDVGGPTANFRDPSCSRQLKYGVCKKKLCLFPEPCKDLKADHSDYIELLRKLRMMKGVKKVFIRSGIRYDYLLLDKDKTFLKELCEHHISGQLKVAPEHISDNALYYMSKPSVKVFEEFRKEFEGENKRINKEQYLVPYFISSHPGCTLNDAILLAEYLRDNNIRPEQVQDFYPTPGTLSTCMYHTGLDPRTMKKIYVAKTQRDKAMQRALLQYGIPANHDLVRDALTAAKREDLIGTSGRCLIKPQNNFRPKERSSSDTKKKRFSSQDREGRTRR
jgi:uncharacterized radical SAM protein YgiQ